MQYLDKFLDWLGVDRSGLDFIIGEHRNPKMWIEEKPGRWSRRDAVAREALPDPEIVRRLGFAADSALDYTGRDAYITIGKGYPL